MQETLEPRARLYKELGEKVSELRKVGQITQAELASAISLSRTSVTNIEKGRQQILLHTLYDLASALRVEPAALLPTKRLFGKAQETLEQHDLLNLTEPEKQWVIETSTNPLGGRS